MSKDYNHVQQLASAVAIMHEHAKRQQSAEFNINRLTKEELCEIVFAAFQWANAESQDMDITATALCDLLRKHGLMSQ